jgi:hypothetical protein
MLIRQLHASAAAPLLVTVILVILCCAAHSTTVVFVVNDSGIVVLADSKATVPEGQMDESCPPNTDTRKVFVVRERFAIASLGANCFHYAKVSRMYEVSFNLSTWINDLQGSLPKDVSFDQFAGITKAKFSELIPKVQIAVASGYWGNPENSMDIFEPMTTFLIAGYDKGVPRLSVVKVYIDWDKKTVLEPYLIRVDLEPIEGQTQFKYAGITQAAANIFERDSYAYKYAMRTYPKTFGEFIAHRAPSLDESITLGRVLIEVEQEVSPKTVGGAIRGVKIAPNGRATEIADSLPKAKTPRKKKHN